MKKKESLFFFEEARKAKRGQNKMKRALQFLCLLMFLASCSSLDKGLKGEKFRPIESPVGLKATSVMDEGNEKSRSDVRFEEIKLPEYERKVERKPLSEKRYLDTSTLIMAKESVSVNVENLPLNEFIIHVIGELLKVPFVAVEDVMKDKSPVTLKMENPLPPEKVFMMASAILEARGILVEERDGCLYLRMSGQVAGKPSGILVSQDLPSSPEEVIYVFPLQYVPAGILESFVREFFKGKVNVRVYTRENAFIFQGTASSVREITDFLKLLDVPFVKDKKVLFIKLIYWQPEELVKQLSAILEGIGFSVAKAPLEPGLRFVPVKYMNGLVAICQDEKVKNVVLEWIQRLDTPESAGTEERAYVYIPKYCRASDLVEAVRNIYWVGEPQQKGTAPDKAPSQPGRPVSYPGLKIAADDKRNMVLIMTNAATYRHILTYLEKLDRPPRQVLIEATVAELTLRDELRHGVEWYLKNVLKEGVYELTQSLGVPGGPGITFRIFSESEKFRAILNLFAAKGLMNILSTPRIMVLDNEEATIQIGTDVPVITGEVASAQAAGATTGIVRTIQYRSTGVILRVKPTVHTEGLLSLNVVQEVSEMGASPPGIDSPTILVRKIATNVVLGQDDTIVIGGLISRSRGEQESKVPFLGEIPGLGNLFKSRGTEEKKTELLVFLKARIVNSLEEARKVTEELKEKLHWFKE
ncbi:MAG: secretin N-terminal domain-containing protein [Candidatus Hadarchaeum sp.]|uniref:secretin N-terminal domain-containing protein n=1 Tax=Candidatus Hadarchaeum sp. TaxID=2883567 RepID=UPI0031774415